MNTLIEVHHQVVKAAWSFDDFTRKLEAALGCLDPLGNHGRGCQLHRGTRANENRPAGLFAGQLRSPAAGAGSVGGHCIVGSSVDGFLPLPARDEATRAGKSMVRTTCCFIRLTRSRCNSSSRMPSSFYSRMRAAAPCFSTRSCLWRTSCCF